MERSELGAPLEKLEVLEGRTFSAEQATAWFEIIGEHSQGDAVAAVLQFHSKPFKRPAYPGDIKALIVESEGVRLRSCGTLQVNEEEWFNGPTGPVYKRLSRLIATGEWSRDEYLGYRRSGLTLDAYLENQEAHLG